MRKSLLTVAFAALAVGFGATAAFADFQSATACQKAQAWDASAGKCVSCSSIVTDAKLLKSCKSCKAGTAFDTSAAKCVKVTVKKG
jgi:hypothetical protein